MSHPEYVLPNTPHAGYRYKMAMKHVDNLPDDAAHKNYKNAVEQAKAAMAEGKSDKEVHELFQKVLSEAK